MCTEEDLSLLNKFPRNNLKLEKCVRRGSAREQGSTNLLLFALPCSFIDRGEFGEVFQGTATDILGVATGPTPVAVKVGLCVCEVTCDCYAGNNYSHVVFRVLS